MPQCLTTIGGCELLASYGDEYWPHLDTAYTAAVEAWRERAEAVAGHEAAVAAVLADPAAALPPADDHAAAAAAGEQLDGLAAADAAAVAAPPAAAAVPPLLEDEHSAVAGDSAAADGPPGVPPPLAMYGKLLAMQEQLAAAGLAPLLLGQYGSALSAPEMKVRGT